jgi:hypothetical protein
VRTTRLATMAALVLPLLAGSCQRQQEDVSALPSLPVKSIEIRSAEPAEPPVFEVTLTLSDGSQERRTMAASAIQPFTDSLIAKSHSGGADSQLPPCPTPEDLVAANKAYLASGEKAPTSTITGEKGTRLTMEKGRVTITFCRP